MFEFKIIKTKLKQFDYISLTTSTIISSIIGFIYSVYAKKYVGPLEYGIFATCSILQSYMGYAQLGTMSTYNRDYPQYLGAKNEIEANKLKNTTLTFNILIYSLICILTFIIIVVLKIIQNIDIKYSIGFISISIILILDNIATFCSYTARMQGYYNFSAYTDLTKSFISVLLGIIAVYFLGYYGLYCNLFITSLLAIYFYYKFGFKDFSFGLDKKVLVNSMKSGLPLMISSLIYTVMSSVDKFIILFFMDTLHLGMYTVPIMGFNTIVIIPRTISQLFYYKISKVFGATQSKDALLNICLQYTKLLSYFTGIAVISSFFILPIFVENIMPKYANGILPAQILIVGVSLYASSMLFSNIFSTLKWNKILIITSILLCVFNIVFSIAMVLFVGNYIENVAIGTSISYALHSFSILLIISIKFDRNIFELIKVSYFSPLKIILPGIILYNSVKSSVYAAIFTSLIIVSFLIIDKPWRLYK